MSSLGKLLNMHTYISIYIYICIAPRSAIYVRNLLGLLETGLVVATLNYLEIY